MMVLHRVIQAARAGDLSALRKLSSSGCLTVSASITDAQGAGPVHHAARCGRLECLRYLVVEVGLAGPHPPTTLPLQATPGNCSG